MQPQPMEIQLQKRPSVEETLSLLQTLYTKLINETSQPEGLIREYISRFIEIHHISDEYFTIFAEHDFLLIMLEEEKKLSNTCILECLNLLIKNTKKQGELVYYLSQGNFHQYLFGFILSDKNTEFVEYYIQLLKTLLMKITQSPTNTTLIKIFCNSKYPNFPLLTNCTLLAADDNQLVRVTAQQCVLIIVGLVNQRDVMKEYLGEWMMLLLVWRLGRQYVGADDREGVVKYLVDLLFQLRHNSLALLMSHAILANTVVIPHLPSNYSMAVGFLSEFGQGMMVRIGETELHKSISDRLQTLLLVHFRLLIKYLTNKYIRAAYLSTLITLTTLPSLQQKKENILIEKLIHEYECKEYLEEQSVEVQKQLHHGIAQKIEEYERSRQFEKMKENYIRKTHLKKDHDNILTSILKKFSHDYSVTQFLKTVIPFVGVTPQKGEPITRTLKKCLYLPTCAFVAEYREVLTKINRGVKAHNFTHGQQSEDCEACEIHFNDIRDSWGFTASSLYCFTTFTKQLLHYIHTSQSQPVIIKLCIPYYFPFLNQLKHYLCCSLHHHFCREGKNEELLSSVSNIKVLGKLTGGLKVKVKEEVAAGLVQQLVAVHNQVQNCVFEAGWKEIVRYVLEEYDKKKNVEVLQQPKEVKEKEYGSAVRKFVMFQAIQKVVDPSLPSVYQLLSKDWAKCSPDAKLPTAQFEASNSGLFCYVTFQAANSPPAVYLKLTSASKKVLVKISISDIEDIRCNKIDGRVVQIIGCQETMKMRTCEQAFYIMKVVKEWKEKIEECTVGACIDYLEKVFNTVIRGVKGKVVKLDLDSMETPR